jgi:pSer/pThr/pTyr-binding forkhead associated (FHA) protein
MPARLVSLDGHVDIELAGILTVVGRHHDCDVRVDSSRVSRRHCCLAVIRDEVVIRDLNSTNGTSVNGHRVRAGAALRHGDELGIAHLRYRLEFPRAVPEAEGEAQT